MERQRHRRTVCRFFSLSLSLSHAINEMVVVVVVTTIIALFFSRCLLVIVDERKTMSSRNYYSNSPKKEKLIVFCTSTDCTSFIVSFTGPVTSATEIEAFIIGRLLLVLLLLVVVDFFKVFFLKVVFGEEMNALVFDIMDTILFVFFLCILCKVV